MLWQRVALLLGALWFRRMQPLTMLVLFLLFLWLSISQCFDDGTVVMPNSDFVTVTSVHPSYVIADTGEQQVVVYGLEDAGYGDVVYVEGTWEQIIGNHNFYQFHYDEYMARRHIYFAMNVKQSYLVQEGTSVKAMLYRHISALEDEPRSIAASMLFGISVQEGSYFLRASGLHLSALAFSLNKRLQRRLSDSRAKGVTIVFLLAMGELFGFSDALVRVLCFRLAALLFHRNADQIGAGIFLTLSLRSYLVSELTFVLPLLFRLAAHFSNGKLRGNAFSLPLLILVQLCYFHEIYWLQTLLFQPLRKLYALLYACVLCALCMPVLFAPLLALIAWMESFSKFTQIGVYHYVPSLLWIAAWVALLFCWWKQAGVRLACAMAALLVFGRIEPYLDPFFEVLIIDVGQGDCALITLPHHQGTVMIDAAGSLYKSIPEEVILPVLEDEQIDRIDLLILTHEDYDHSGGYEELASFVEIEQVLRVKQDVSDPLAIYALLADYEGADANDNSIISWFGYDGLSYLFMGDASTQAEAALLEEYDGLPCDVLKLGHHGSDTSSSLRFLHAMKPQLALISVGEDNRYGHPSPEVLDALCQESIPYLSTAQHGAIRIRTTKLWKYVVTARGEFVIIDNR